MGEPLIEMHGNNGSMDGDPPAAMRYTEARPVSYTHLWKKRGKRVASVPFSKSKAKTEIPAFTPRILKVLVVPVFPEP